MDRRRFVTLTTASLVAGAAARHWPLLAQGAPGAGPGAVVDIATGRIRGTADAGVQIGRAHV